MTLRLRLTLLYGATFLIAGAGMLAITYALWSETGGRAFVIHGRPVAAGSGSGGGFFFNLPQAKSGPSVYTTHPTRSASAPSSVRATPRPGAHGGATVHTTNPVPTNASGLGAAPFLAGLPPPARQAFMRFMTEAQGLAQKYGLALQTSLPPAEALIQHANANIQQAAKTGNIRLADLRSTDKSSLLLWSGVALGGMAVLSILLGWLMAGRALRPLRTMNQRAREITEESLHQRVGVEQRSDELGELAATFDALLERLEQAFDAQRRFVANASHELRTPLTLERTLVEVALADPDASVASLRRACERVLASGAQQERVIDALLTLARGQAGIDAREQIDLAELTEDVLAGRASETGGLKVDATLEPAVVDGDCALLERLVTNLIDNAIAHNLADGGWIKVETRVEAGRPLLRVLNSGPVVPPDRLDDLFEPFRRLEGERTAEGQGLGLGLSIVRAIALAHDAELAATAPPEGGLELNLRFPASNLRLGDRARAASGADRQLAGRVGVSL